MGLNIVPLILNSTFASPTDENSIVVSQYRIPEINIGFCAFQNIGSQCVRLLTLTIDFIVISGKRIYGTQLKPPSTKFWVGH